jgi:hypothetical protein
MNHETQNNDWQKRFKRQSDQKCSEHLEMASRVELGKKAAALACLSMARFHVLGLWRHGDSVGFVSWSSLIEFRWNMGMAQGMAQGLARSYVSASDSSVKKAWRLWSSGDREGGLAELSGAIEMGALDILIARSLEGGQTKREQLCAALGSTPLERAVRAALLKAAPKERDPGAYPSLARDFFLKRVRQLQEQGLLPAASFVSVDWRRTSSGAMYSGHGEERGSSREVLRCALEWRPEPLEEPPAQQPLGAFNLGMMGLAPGMAQAGAFGPNMSVGHQAGQVSMGLSHMLHGNMGHSAPIGSLGARRLWVSEADFMPSVGFWGMFQIGGLVHGLWIRMFGAQRALEADWERFEAKLAKAHASLLAEIKANGGLEGLARADKVELSLGLQAKPSHGEKAAEGLDDIAPQISARLRL